jgi:hypothetical protein
MNVRSLVLGVPLAAGLCVLPLVGCSSNGAASSAPGGGVTGDDAGPSPAGEAGILPGTPDCQGDGGAAWPTVDDANYAPTYRMRLVGSVPFQSKTYSVVNSMPWDYLLSHVQAGKSFPVTETADYYQVASNFELPYLPCVMDDVSWTPGNTNKGWAIGVNDDPAALVAKNGAGRPFVYHVISGDEYGYDEFFDPLPNDPIRYSGYRPTWVVHPDGASYTMYYADPTNPDKYGFPWPRHGSGWELIFGLFVDPSGNVYVPKKAPLALQSWDTYFGCVVINAADAPVPTTRTQFPGNESYYASETFLPGYAAPSASGHRYWGQKGRSMQEVAVWEDDGGPNLPSPGNFHKPYEGGCSVTGYNFAHAEGFTWPALRAYRTSIGDIPTREQLYKVTVYKVASDGTSTLLGTLSYTQQSDGQWIPTGSGPGAHSLNDANGRWIIDGAIYKDRGERAVAVVENL